LIRFDRTRNSHPKSRLSCEPSPSKNILRAPDFLTARAETQGTGPGIRRPGRQTA
jgi:hypothetical protein